MSNHALEYVATLMNSLSLPYAFMQWNDEAIPEMYFVSEYNEVPMTTKEEDGRKETTIILRGFTRGNWLLLEEARAKIEANATQTAILDDGTGIAVFYDSGTIVPTGDAELKSIKINLTIQEWSVN